MRPSLVIGNWKMHGSKAVVGELLKALLREYRDVSAQGVGVVVCPPSPYLDMCQAGLFGSSIELGAQNVHTEFAGAYTGEVSAPMLSEFDVRYVIVGHSERREYFAETNELVARKFAAVLAGGMTPVLCVGESLAERESGLAQRAVMAQIEAVVAHSGVDALTDSVLAYEPVWAIGTGRTASPQQAQEMHGYMRSMLSTKNAQVAAGLRILYGGSVNAANAAELFAQKDIDGGLVGGASLKPEEFITIVKSVGR
jgi:triosephosphate isomerase